MDNIGLPLSLIFILVIMSGYFTLVETSLMESHKSRLEKLTDDREILNALESPEKFLTAAQIGLTFTEIFASLIAILTALVVLPYFSTFLAALIASVLVTLIMILFGEFLPSRIARLSPEKFFIEYYRSIKIISILMSPLIFTMKNISTGIMMLFGMNEEPEDAVTEDEVKDLIEQGREDGTFKREEQALVDRIFQLGDETAYSLMTPRTQIVWLDINDPIDHNLKIIADHKNEILPVGNGSLDECRGILYTKDLLDFALTKKLKEIDLTTLLKKPIYVPRTMDAFRLLEKFRSAGVHAAMILDEYGGVVGFITLNDLLTEIVGDDSNTDTESTQFLMINKDTYFVDGLFEIDDFKKRFDIEEMPNEEEDHFQTLGGFLISYLGKIPIVGDNCEWNGLKFEILNMDRARIDKVRITKL